MVRGLVVTADDFGLSTDVNIAVEMAHKNGILTSASLMTGAPAVGDAIERGLRLPSLAIGLHVVVVDGLPTLPAEEIPCLIDERGFLRNDLTRFGLELAVCAKTRSQLRTEIRAQFEAFSATGLLLSHVDVHKHYHLHPLVAADIIAIGHEFGIRSLRVPIEPPGILRSIERCGRQTAWMLAPSIAHLRKQALRAGLLTADVVFGWAWSGAWNESRMTRLLSNAPEVALTEIYCHPAITDDFQGHAEGYGYRAELEALTSVEVANALERSGFALTSYGRVVG